MKKLRKINFKSALEQIMKLRSIDWRAFANKVVKFRIRKEDLQHTVDKYFKGNFENFYIAVVGGVGCLLAILILAFSGSAPSGGHGHGGEEHDEGKKAIELSEDALNSSGMKLEAVKKGSIHRIVKLRGRISVNRDRFTKISSRYSGTVSAVNKALGDSVNKGDALARVESAAARSSFDVRSGISGVIVDRQAVRGVFVSDKEPMFTVVDLSNVWAELNASDTDFESLKTGQKVRITDSETGKSSDATVSYVSPNVYEDTQSLIVRAVIDNKDRSWRPGSFIEAELNVEEKEVAASIRIDAVQTIDNKPAIFVKNGDDFEVREVTLGTSDNEFVELITGAKEGDIYIASKSFIAKAELLKSSAEHEH